MMTKTLHLIYILFFCGLATAVGQNAEPVYYPLAQPLTGINSIMACTDQNAGSYIFTNGRGLSTDLTAANLATMPNRLFLCKGDSLDLMHTGGDLTGDPVLSSPAGYGYAIYSCAPNQDGTLDNVTTDCVFNNLPISPLLMVTQGRRDGNVTFFNECFFQDDARFLSAPRNIGDPIEIHFAPITFDSLTPSGNAAWEIDPVAGGNPGPCVDVNIDDRFSVVYLNEITADYDLSRCQLSVRIKGGLPEYETLIQGNLNERYDIAITKTDDPSVSASSCTGNLRPLFNNPAQFTFPESGDYRVVITDGYSCIEDTTITVTCETVNINLGADMTVDVGDTVCVDVTVENFITVFGFQFNYLYDPAILEFIDIRNIHPELVNGSFSSANPTGRVTGVTFNLGFAEMNIPDGETALSICYRVLDRPGECMDMRIGTSQAQNASEVTNLLCPYPSFFSSKEICVERASTMELAACSTTGNTGELIFGPTEGTPPFTYEIFLTSDLSTALRNGSFNNIGDMIAEVGFVPGDYTVRITDASGLVDEDNIPIENALRIRIDRPFDIIEPSCIGLSDGRLLVTGISGGVPDIDRRWSTGPEDIDSITGLSNGRYVFYAEDRYGCIDSISETIGADSIFIDFTEERLVNCPGDNNGVIFAEGRGGNGPYDFIWDGGQRTPNVFSDRNSQAMGGWNVLELIDDNGCRILDSFFLDAINILDTDVQNLDISCAGLQDGSITITPTSGQGPYTYEWEDIGLSDSIRTLLGEGTYNVVVSDAAGCFDSLELRIIDPDSVFVSIDSVNSNLFLCPGEENAALFLNVQVDPARDFTLTVNGDPLVGTLSLFNRAPGVYNFNLTDERGCNDTETYEVISTPRINFVIPEVAIPDCPGDTTFVTVQNASGGAGAPYQFRVDNASAFFNLGEQAPIFSGTRIIEIVDAEGCTRDTLITVGDPDPIQIFLPELVEIELGDSTRIIPDIQPFASRDSIVSYQWFTADGSEIGLSCYDCLDPYFSGPDNQVYTFIATDVKGCTYEATVPARVIKVRNVFLPNAFTPETELSFSGSSGYNDRLHIGVGPGIERINYFRVFNRQGAMVHHVTNFTPETVFINGWDGYFQGVPQNPGVYVYVAEVLFIDGEVIVYRSDATLIH